MLFGIFCMLVLNVIATGILGWCAAGILGELQIIKQQQETIMSALDDLKASAARLETVSASAGQKLDADAATIKDDVTKLASLAAQPQAASDADLKAITDRINAVADGLSGHLTPVQDAAGAIAASAAGATS